MYSGLCACFLTLDYVGLTEVVWGVFVCLFCVAFVLVFVGLLFFFFYSHIHQNALSYLKIARPLMGLFPVIPLS